MAGYFELKTMANGNFMFVLKAGNHQVILTSQGYKEKRSAQAGIESVRKNGLEDGRYERKTASNGSPHFSLTATNGQIIGSSEMYSSTAAMENGIASCKANCASDTVKDLTAAA
ncbi:MAG: YegP family protein [Thiobacillus sp.]|nr:YegP family protein [Thiobacillus sp.]